MAAPLSAELFAFVRGEQSLGLHILCSRPREEFGNNAKGSVHFLWLFGSFLDTFLHHPLTI
jgi:hypothetical protein